MSLVNVISKIKQQALSSNVFIAIPMYQQRVPGVYITSPRGGCPCVIQQHLNPA